MTGTVRLRTTLFGGLAVTALALSACGGTSATETSSETGSVVASTTIWGDIASQIVECAGTGEVTTLIPVGADPHEFSPSSDAVAQMVNADLVVVNGLELEEGLESALESAEQDGANVYAVAPNLDPMPFGEAAHSHSDEGTEATDEAAKSEEEEHSHSGEEHSHSGEEHSHSGEEHSHSGDDPHVWLDMTRAASGAALIGQQLTEATGNEAFTTCGEEVAADIEATNAEVTALLESVPADKRILVTDHDAFGYFGTAYGYEIAGVVIPGGSTLGDPSSAELAELAATIKAEGVPAIFANVATPSTLTDALASEVGNVIVVPLFVGSVGEPGTPEASFQGMMLANAQRISDALNS
jgi:zinc/manganese transport system substrate-binding protein